MMHKLENPKRIMELAPSHTLVQIGLREDSIFCDIGAGSGVFTFPAAHITLNTVYAIDTSEHMRQILRSKSAYANVVIESHIKAVPDHCCDIALLCTVLHEIENVPQMLDEIKRILKKGGALAVIEFHKRLTPMGPPLDRRLSEDETATLLQENGFSPKERLLLGENFYLLLHNES